MNSIEFLKKYQNLEEIYEVLFQFVPQGGGGSDLVNLPDWLVEQFNLISDKPFEKITFKEIVKIIFTDEWVKSSYSLSFRYFNGKLKELLQINDRLQIGCHRTTSINGFIITLPELSDHRVILLPFGSLDFGRQIGSLLNICLDYNIIICIVEGLNQFIQYQEPEICKTMRLMMSSGIEGTLRPKYEKSIATELDGLFFRYTDIGVIDPTFIVRSVHHAPFLGDPKRAGHLLEFGGCLAEFVVQFLLLHEYGHLVLQDAGIATTSKWEMEFKADEMVICFAKDFLPGKAQDAILLTAMILFESIRWMENYQAGSQGTHPPAHLRIEKFSENVSLVYKDQPDRLKFLYKGFSNIAEVFAKLFQLSFWREYPERLSTIESALYMAVYDKNPNLFKDSVMRWLVIGANENLCDQLAKARIKYERLVQTEPQIDHSQKLELLNWVYETVKVVKSGSLIKKLDAAYALNLKQMQNDKY